MSSPQTIEKGLIPVGDGAFVYRVYSTRGELLYVGRTESLLTRFNGHRSQPWWFEMGSVAWELWPSRAVAVEAELTAIQNERPRYNRAGSEDGYHRPGWFFDSFARDDLVQALTVDTGNDLMKESGAARLLDVHVWTLQKWRQRGEGPPYVKIGRLVRYSRRALAMWLESHAA
jgi:hypothetical protein